MEYYLQLPFYLILESLKEFKYIQKLINKKQTYQTEFAERINI